MKTILTFKSLLIAGGLLFIGLSSLHFAFKCNTSLVKTSGLNKNVMTIRSQIDSGETTLFEEIAGKLFPVLKNLSRM
jgi:hypothetical protein